MGRKSLADVRQKELIEAFIGVVANKGITRATTREVTEAAGLSSCMLHHYFDNKEAMIVGVLDYLTVTYMAAIQDRISQRDSAIGRLESFISWCVDVTGPDINPNQALTEIRAYARTSPAVSDALRRFYDMGKNLIAGIISAGIESGEFRQVDPAVAANTLLANLDGVVRLWFIDPGGTPLEEVGKNITELFSGYLARRS